MDPNTCTRRCDQTANPTGQQRTRNINWRFSGQSADGDYKITNKNENENDGHSQLNTRGKLQRIKVETKSAKKRKEKKGKEPARESPAKTAWQTPIGWVL